MAKGGIYLFKRPSVIPGFGLALGFTPTYFSLIVLIPLATLIVRSSSLGSAEFLRLTFSPRRCWRCSRLSRSP